MPVEDLEGPDKFLDALVITNPLQTDPGYDLGPHSRGIKNVLVNTFGARDKALNVFDEAHPVGSVFLSLGLDPNSLAGTWIQIAEGRFLIGAGTLDPDTYEENEKGGSARHTLTVDEMPSHHHDRPRAVGSGGSLTALTGNLSSVTGAYASSDAGGDQPHENRPPYLAVTVWQRTA